MSVVTLFNPSMALPSFVETARHYGARSHYFCTLYKRSQRSHAPLWLFSKRMHKDANKSFAHRYDIRPIKALWGRNPPTKIHILKKKNKQRYQAMSISLQFTNCLDKLEGRVIVQWLFLFSFNRKFDFLTLWKNKNPRWRITYPKPRKSTVLFIFLKVIKTAIFPNMYFQ